MEAMDFGADPFSLFGLPRSFAIDARYRQIQAQVHPDRFAGADDAQRRLSLQWATKANEAYQTLKKPLSRALCLLELHGEGVDLADNHAMTPEFLVEQMEWREAVADARNAGSTAELEDLERRVRSDLRDGYRQLGALLDEEADFAAAADRVRRQMFLEKLLTDIEDALSAVDA